MNTHTVYKTFHTVERREFVRVTEDVQSAVDDSGVEEGMVLVSAMHITAAELARAVPELWEDGDLPDDALARYEVVLAGYTEDIPARRTLLKALIEHVETVPGTRPKQVRIAWR